MRQVDRAKWIVTQIRIEDPGADVITIQEAFDEGNALAFFANSGYKALEEAMTDAGYIFRTRRPRGAGFENGGVLIFSRWPIEYWDNNIFDPGKCTGADCLAAKGLNYAKINKLGHRYHFFTTHLQAGHSHFNIRKQQLEEFWPWMRGLIGQTDEPAILTGDYNIDMETQPQDYAEMLRLLRAEFVNAPRSPGVPTGPVRYRYSADPAANEITNFRGGTAEWLDYILVSRIGPLPEQASYVLKQYKRSEDYGILVAELGFGSERRVRDLSDHGALIGTLVFPYGTLRAPQVETVPISFRAVEGRTEVAPTAVKINGEPSAMPVTVDLQKTLTHQIEFVEIPAVNGMRYKFLQWTGGYPAAFDLVNPNSAKNFEAELRRQYQVTVNVNPPAAGTVTGAGWYDLGANADLFATANPNYKFTGFTGAVTTSQNPARVKVEKPMTVTANFVSTLVPITFQARSSGANPANAQVAVNGDRHILPVTLQLDPAQTYRIEAFDVNGISERFLFRQWSHGPGRAWDLVKPTVPQTYIADFTRQFLLTIAASPTTGGTVSGGGWYDFGGTATIGAVANAGFVFSSFSGDTIGTAANATVSMNSAKNVVANFASAGRPVLFVQPGPRRDDLQGRRIVPLILRNASNFAAINARVTAITAIVVVQGSGVPLPMTRFPVRFGTLGPNGSASRDFTFDWPVTAARIQFLVRYEADGGNVGSMTLNVTR